MALLVGHLLRDTPGYIVRDADGSLAGDITHYVYWTRLVTLGGIQSAYGGTWPETYAVYPPVTLYAVPGRRQRCIDWLQDPTLRSATRAQDSLWLREGIKFVALVWHLLTAAGDLSAGRRRATRERRAAAGALYVAQPGRAVRRRPLGVSPTARTRCSASWRSAGSSLGQVIAPWAAMALAALAKPQAWVAAAAARDRDAARARSARPGARAGRALARGRPGRHLPFVVTGHAGELLSLPGTVSSVMPVVSADAHNLWWLVVAARAARIRCSLPDSTRARRPADLSHDRRRRWSAPCSLLTYWLYWTRRASLAEAAALGVLGWFTFTTQAHENHLFFACRCCRWPGRRGRSLLVPFGVISVTLLLNMVLHDQLVLEALGRELDDPLVERLRLANAALNVVCCLGWCVWPAAAPERAASLQ